MTVLKDHSDCHVETQPQQTETGRRKTGFSSDEGDGGDAEIRHVWQVGLGHRGSRFRAEQTGHAGPAGAPRATVTEGVPALSGLVTRGPAGAPRVFLD